MQTPSSQKFWQLMELRSMTFGLILLGLGIRIIALIALADLPLGSDPLGYHTMAIQLSENEKFSPFWPPGLPYYLLIFYSIFGESEFTGRVAMLFFYLVFNLSLFLLAKEITTTKIANLVVLVFVLFPTYIFHSVEILTMLPAATYLILITYLMVLMKKRFLWIYPIALGLVISLLILTRPSSIIFLVLIPIYIFFTTKKISAAIVPLFLSMLIIFIWVEKAHQMTGRWIFINDASSVAFFNGNNTYTPLYKTWWFGSHTSLDVPESYKELKKEINELPPEIQNSTYRKTAINHIKQNIDLFFIRTINRARNFFAFDTFTGGRLIGGYSINKLTGLTVIFFDALFYCTIMLFAIRFFFARFDRNKPFEYIGLLLLITIGYAAPYWIAFSHPTYHFPITPFFGIIAAKLIVEKLDTTSNNSSPWLWKPMGKKRYVYFFITLLFVLIQIEWIIRMWDRI